MIVIFVDFVNHHCLIGSYRSACGVVLQECVWSFVFLERVRVELWCLAGFLVLLSCCRFRYAAHQVFVQMPGEKDCT
jgi:hypothetical protein